MYEVIRIHPQTTCILLQEEVDAVDLDCHLYPLLIASFQRKALDPPLSLGS